MTRDQICDALDAPFVMNLEARYGKDCDVLAVLERCLAINVATPYVNLRGACTQAVKNEARPRLLGVIVPPAPAVSERANEAIAIRHVTQFVKVASSYKQFSPAELADEIEFGTNGFTPELARCIALKLRKLSSWPSKKTIA